MILSGSRAQAPAPGYGPNITLEAARKILANARLELRKAELLAPGRVEKIAREELGLVDPKPDEIIYKDGTTSR